MCKYVSISYLGVFVKREDSWFPPLKIQSVRLVVILLQVVHRPHFEKHWPTISQAQPIVDVVLSVLQSAFPRFQAALGFE